MKIRHCFVSNSSTSSFCLMGVYFYGKSLEKLKETFNMDVYQVSEYIDDKIYDDDYLEFGNIDVGRFVIGVDINKCIKDETKTIREIKQDILERIQKIEHLEDTKIEDIKLHEHCDYEC